MTIIWSKIVNYVSESVNYLTYQSPIYVSITFIYIIHFIHASRFPKYWDFFFFSVHLGLYNGFQAALLTDSCFAFS